MTEVISRMSKKLQSTMGCYRVGIVLFAICLSFAGTVQRVNADVPALMDFSASVDEKRLFALGMIESGNDDRGVGAAGEISRYQIQPSVWRFYSESRKYQEPDIARGVACQHWNHLAGYFRQKTGRDPSDFDMYVLWNTRFGYYASKSFDPRRLDSTVHDRARRFVNLVNR